MPAASRLGDTAEIQADAHGCPGCPHPGKGPLVNVSTDVFINGRGAARLDDLGIHAICCGPNIFQCAKGSPTVYVNNKPLMRIGDQTKHCGGDGKVTDGSPDVFSDDSGADAKSLGDYLIAALQLLLEQADKLKEGKAKAHSDSHEGGESTGPAQDLASDGKSDDKKAGSIASAGWSQARASNGQEVELQIACKNGEGSLKVEIWARGSDPTQDKCVQKLEAQAGDSVKQKVKLDIPSDAAPNHECFFYYVVKDAKGGEKKSPMLYVDRAPFKFSS
jgi:uncharacterized Zn-binding protein involved in type VI secretion